MFKVVCMNFLGQVIEHHGILSASSYIHVTFTIVPLTRKNITRLPFLMFCHICLLQLRETINNTRK